MNTIPADPSLRSCLYSGPGRGDCEHFVGLPKVIDETTTDCYGRPHNWCEVCWRGEQIADLARRLEEAERLLKMAYESLRGSSKYSPRAIYRKLESYFAKAEQKGTESKSTREEG